MTLIGHGIRTRCSFSFLRILPTVEADEQIPHDVKVSLVCPFPVWGTSPLASGQRQQALRVGRLADLLRMARRVLQIFQVIRVILPLLAVEGLGRDAKIASGEAGVFNYGIYSNRTI